MSSKRVRVWCRNVGMSLLVGALGSASLSMLSLDAVAAVAAGVSPAGMASAGMVKRLVGAVTVVRGGQSMPASVGMQVLAGDELRTARGASLGVTFADNSVVSLGPNSRYSVERFRFNSTTHQGEFVSRLGRGSLAMVSGKLAKQSPDAVTVRTPSTMLGVRGTHFVVDVQ